MHARIWFVAAVVGMSLGFGHAGAEDAPAPAPARPREPAPTSFRVGGDVLAARSWTVAEIATEFAPHVRDVDWTLKDKPHKSKAIALGALVAAAKPAFDEKMRRHDLSFVVVVRDRDGRTTAFALAELDPELRGTEAWIALDDDAMSLSEKDAPAGLLVTNDLKKTRWLRGIEAIFVLDARKNLPK